MTVGLPARPIPRFGFDHATLEIKPATMADKTDLVMLFDRYRQGAGEATNEAAVEQYLSQRLMLGDSVSLIARVNNKPTGFVQLFKRFGAVSMKPYWYIQDLFVVPEERRVGVAKGLLNKAKEWTQFDGSNRLDLKTKWDNYAAQALYEGQSFTVTERSNQFVYYQWKPTQ